ncbi:MAG: hypothetical protein IH586_12150 [Anaerolineaceae bacterium]|nr:hypothetical protein [Anaerolineaceae bacterium]
MEDILPYLKNYEVWIYSLLGLIALVYLQKLIIAWKDWQGTVYGLEREIAQRRFSTALTILLLLVAFVLLEFLTVSFVAPSYPQSLSLPTATLDLLATPTVTLSTNINGITSASTVESTLVVTAQPPQQEGCIPGQIEWVDPKPGQEISQTVELKGTVNVPNLGFYKYQYSKPQEDVWTDIAAGNQGKLEGQIGFWNTSSLVPGDYLLRLVVLDNQNQPFPACVIPVRVMQP